MAAPRKITAEQRSEIVRRRNAGEGIQSIAADFGIAHQTVSRVAKRAAQETRERERQRQAKASLTPQKQWRPPDPASRTGKRLVPDVFATWEERLAYYDRRKLESEIDYLNFNDVIHGRETPAERRARKAGTRLSLR